MAKKKETKVVGSGMVNFVYEVDHGYIKKGTVKQYHETTARALVAHKIGLIEGETADVADVDNADVEE